MANGGNDLNFTEQKNNSNFSDFNFLEQHMATISEKPIVVVVCTFNLMPGWTIHHRKQ